MNHDLTEVVRAIVADEKRLPIDSVKEDSSFLDLGIDSLEGVNIVFALEDRFDINIPDEAAFEFKTVKEVVERLEELLSKTSEASERSA